MDGYRTLLVAMRVLDADEAEQFMTECSLAESDILNKETKLQQVYDKWERELSLLGATVLEDRLQENVQSTIQALHQADIKVWVLTGDKLETAESIGYSSKLLNLGMDVLHCRDADDVRRLFNREQASQQEADILSGQ
jgi:magnesium-transporting ATPase (P-type)